MKKISTFLVLLLCLLNLGAVPDVYGQTPAPLPYSQNFNTANDFTLLNGSQTNKWFYGSATGNTGNSLYISNTNGTTNAYSTSATSVVQAYRDLTIPTGASVANFSFDWKGTGESGWDYLRVWMVPATFTPTTGTQITAGSGRIQIGTEFIGQTAWQTYSTISLNISSFAGSTMRLVFEWRNDDSFGTQPPIAIDNINVSVPSCFPPSAPTTGTITTNSAVLSWTAPGTVPANGYEYYLSTNPTAPTAATTGVANAGTSVTVALAPSTTYYWWVRSVCGATNKSVWIAASSFSTLQVPTTIPYVQNFSTGNDLQLTGSGQPNVWFYGSVTGNPANSLYITNDNGVTNGYNTSASSVVHAFRDIIVPSGSTNATLSFDWKGEGESGWDYLRVWLVPISYVPVAGTQITAGGGRIQLGGDLNQQSTWQNYFNTLVNLSSFAGQNVRLVFEWRNDGVFGTQPAAAIDNINLSIPTCQVPTNIAITTVGSSTATVTWTAAVPAPVGGYQYYLSTTNVAPVAGTTPTGTSAGTTLNLASLTPNTTYYIWVRSVCSGPDRSFWMAGPSFTTTQIPATIPYIQTFTTGSDMGYTNGTQVNKWTYGSATGNTGNSLYISNTNGTTNAYNISSTSVVHAYRDIIVPSGTTTAIFSFDWKGVGESSFDYLRVWMVPAATFMPVSGTQITAGAGRIQIGTNYNQQTTWQNVFNPTLNISSFAGTTMRLVFEWRNDGSGGTQPPIAIDNINLRICNNATPTVTLGTPTYNSIVLTWNQDIGGATYTVRYRPITSPAGPWQTVNVAAAAAPATTNTTTLTNLLSATQYEVEVAAICNTNTGVYSHSTFTTRCDPTPPNVTVSNITTTSALITWSPLASSSHYFLRYRIVGSGAGGWSANIPLPLAPANTFTLGGLSVFTTYEVQVANMCDNENTLNPWSNPKVFTTERTCEIAPPGLTITNITTTTAQVTWAAFPGATYVLRYRKVGIPSWTTVTSNTNTITLTGLLELTQYEMQVANICSGTPGNYTLPYLFTTPTIVYCQMQATTASSNYISKVTVTPNGKPVMTNSSVASNYTDYTGVTNKFIELIQGSVDNKISIDKTSGNAGVAVWIDFNRNGYFDINERILVSGPNTDQTVNGTFSVPADAFISMTDYKYVVMRVAMSKDAIPVNCTNFPNGEVEDYTIRISKLPVPNPVDQNEILLYPNPVKTVLNIKNISPKANYKIYNATGQVVSSGIILNNKIDVHALINGIYVIDIDDVKGTAQKKFIKE